MLRWWWVIAIVAIGFGIVARQVASSRQHGAYRATVTVREVEFDMSGSNGRYSLPRVVQPKVLPDPASYELSAAVANAAQALSVSQGIVRDAVSGKALDATEAQLAYDAGSAAAARRGAAAYAAAYVKVRQGEQISMLTTALTSVPAVADTSGGQDAHLAITNALAAVPKQITVGGDPSVEKQTASISPAAALLAGLMTGLATGVLLALALQRFDPRVRNASALDPADMDVYDSTPAGIAGLRVDLELSAVRPDGGVVAVVPTDGRRGVRASATELAHAFAAAGRRRSSWMWRRTVSGPACGASSTAPTTRSLCIRSVRTCARWPPAPAPGPTRRSSRRPVCWTCSARPASTPTWS